MKGKKISFLPIVEAGTGSGTRIIFVLVNWKKYRNGDKKSQSGKRQLSLLSQKIMDSK